MKAIEKPHYEVVISGIAGYFPESNNVDELRDILFEKRDVVNSINNRNWKMVTREGVTDKMGLMPRKFYFDAQFFGLPPKIVRPLDPMIRIIMERSMEAMVDAGVNPYSIRGRNVGVVVGSNISESESSWLFVDREGGSGILGHNRAMLANRISYFFNFHGPSFATISGDTAGAQALEIGMKMVEDGQCEAAIVSCTNLIVHPNITLNMNMLNLISPDGKTRCFDANASGYARSEACPVLFLQRKEDAKRVYATIIDSGHIFIGNRQDDFLCTKSEYNLSFLKEFYQRSGIDPKQIDFIEAEGRGNKYRDAEELNAIEEFFVKNQGRTSPLLVGSVNSVIGHTGPSTNFCSLFKVLIAMQEGKIPANINYEEPSPLIPGLQNGSFKVITDTLDWKGGIVAINGVGLGSEYSQIIVKSHGLSGPKEITSPADGLPRLMLVSGRSEDGLQKLVAKIDLMPLDAELIGLFHDVFNTKIPNHLYRSYTIINTSKSDSAPAAREVERCDGKQRPIWFIFSGMGSQWPTMACHLMQLPIFAETIEICHNILLPKGVDLKHIITTDDTTIFDNILHSFVGIAAIQMALVDVLRSLDIVPDGIIGHSVGELGCAYADGCFTREEMILSAYSRGRASIEAELIQGMMAAIGLSYTKILPMLPDDVEVACHNSDSSCTISGPTQSIETFVEELKGKGIFARAVNVSNIAYHSRYIKPAAPALLKYLKEVIKTPIKRSSKWISTSIPQDQWNGEIAQYSSAEYHTNNLLSSVLFEEGSTQIPANAICIEIAPHGLLQAILRRSLDSAVTNIPMTQRSNPDGLNFLLTSIAKMYLAGLNPKIENLYPPVSYPVSKGTPSLSPYVDWDYGEEWQVLYCYLKSTTMPCEMSLDVSLNNAEFTIYKGNTYQGSIIYPLSSYLYLIWDMITVMNDFSMDDTPIVFENVKMHEVLYIPTKGSVVVQAFFQRGTGRFEISLADEERIIVTGTARVADFDLSTDQWINAETRESILNNLDKSMEGIESSFQLEAQDIYSIFERRGNTFAGPFRALENLTLCERGVIGKVNWSSNWISNLDALMQVPLFLAGEASHVCRLNTSFKKLIIDPRMFGKGKDIKHNLTYVNNMEILMMNGVELRGVESEPLVIKPEKLPQFHIDNDVYLSRNEPAVQEYQPMLEMFLNIVMTNCSKPRLTILSFNQENTQNLIDNVAKILPTFDFASNIEYNFRQLDSTTPSEVIQSRGSDHLIVSSKYKEAYDMLDAFSPETFLLLRTTTDQPELSKKYKIICKKSFQNEIYYLIKQNIKVDESSLVYHLTGNSSEWKNQISPLLTSEGKKVYVVAKSLPSHGVIAFIKLLIIEKLTEQIRLILILDSNSPTFSLKDKFYQEQLSLDLFVNILYKNDWVFSCRLFLDKVSPIQGNNLNFCLLSTAQYRNIEFKYIGLNPDDITYVTDQDTEEKRKYKIYAKNIETSHLEWSGLVDCRQRSMGLAVLNSTGKINIDKNFTWTIPAKWSYEDAASVPLAYAFAYHCLFNMAQLESKYSVLIHCAFNVFSQAALRIVLAMGNPIIFVTVSDETEKQNLLQDYPQLTADRVFLYTNFEENILEITKGKRVEIIFSPLADQQLRATFRCLGYMGTYIHVGVLDIKQNTQIGMMRFLESCSFFAADFESMINARQFDRENIHKLMEHGIRTGVVQPLERKVFPFENLESGITSVNESSVPTVKTIVKMPPKPLLGPVNKSQKQLLRKHFYGDVSNLIVSSRMDYALDLAEWLNERGVRYLFIAAYDNNHSGSITTNIQYRLAALTRKYGSQIVLIPSKSKTGWTTAQEMVNLCQTTAPFANIFLVQLDGSSDLVQSLDSLTQNKNKVDIFAALQCWNVHNFCLERQQLGLSAISVTLRDSAKSEFWHILGSLDRILSFESGSLLSVTRLKATTSKGGSSSANADQLLQLFLPNIEKLEALGKEVSTVLKLRGDTTKSSDLIEVATRSLGIGYAREVPAIFMVPGLNGSSADTVRSIAKMLLYPIMVLQMPIHPGTLEEIAENLVEQIFNVQDVGPYNLCGVSWGGPVVLETTRLLERLGHKVKVFLYDGAPDTVQENINILDVSTKREVNIICRCLEISSLRVREELSALGDWSSRMKRALEEIPVSQQKREYLTYGLETLRSRLELISRFPSEYDPLLSCSVHLVRKAASDDDDENCGLDKYTKSPVDSQSESSPNTLSELINLEATVEMGQPKYKIPLAKKYLKV